MPKYQDPNFDKKAYAWGKRSRPLKARGIVQLDKFGRPIQLLPVYSSKTGHKPISKKAFKKNTRRARRYYRIEEEAMNASN